MADRWGPLLTSPNLKPFEFTYLMTGSRPLYTRSFGQERVIPTHCLLAGLTLESVTRLALLYRQHLYGLPNNLQVCALDYLTSLTPPPTHSLTIKVDVFIACLFHAIGGHCISNAHNLLAGAVVSPTPANEE